MYLVGDDMSYCLILSAEIKHYNHFYSGSTDDVDIYILHVITKLHFMY